MHMLIPSTLSNHAKPRMSLTKMGTQQHPTNTAMVENQALPTSAYLDAQSTSNVMNQLSATSSLPTNNNFSMHSMVSLLDFQKTQLAGLFTLLNIPSAL
jgi:hypothetical protein